MVEAKESAAANAVFASEGWLRGLVEQTLAGIYLIQDGYLRYVNQGFADIFGYASPGDLIDKVPIKLLIAPEDQQKVIENVKLRTEGSVSEMRYTFVGLCRDGRRIDLEVHGRSMEFNGAPAVIGLILDISERKQAERAKSAFLRVISHELRTPLNHIMGLTSLLKQDVEGERGKVRLATLAEASQRLLTLIDAVLDFSRLEGGAVVEMTDFDLRRILELAERRVQKAVAQKGIELVTELPPDFPASLKGDAAHIAKVLDCLLGNAEKFSERGRITIRAALGRATGGVTVLRIEVEDQGIGIAPELQSGLFELFNQGDNSLARRYGGVGLGLAMSKSLVQMMHGEVGYATTPGQGSSFWFKVPIILNSKHA